MNITTKFQVGDTAFRLHANQVQSVEIKCIEIHVREKPPFCRVVEIEIKYRLDCPGESHEKIADESNLFTTKADLLASL